MRLFNLTECIHSLFFDIKDGHVFTDEVFEFVPQGLLYSQFVLEIRNISVERPVLPSQVIDFCPHLSLIVLQGIDRVQLEDQPCILRCDFFDCGLIELQLLLIGLLQVTMLPNLRDLFRQLLQAHVQKVILLLKLELRVRHSLLEDTVDGFV